MDGEGLLEGEILPFAPSARLVDGPSDDIGDALQIRSHIVRRKDEEHSNQVPEH